MLLDNAVGQSMCQQTTAHRPNSTQCLFLHSLLAKNGYYIFKWLKKNQKENDIS